jgi:cation:H+ antiporter
MTGGNQLLIGVGWPLVVLLGTWRMRRHVRKNALPAMTGTDHVELEPGQAIDIAHLTLATIYGLTLPLRSSLTMVDFAVLVAIYAAYLIRLAKAPPEAPHLVGPAALLGTLPTTQRRLTNVALFVVAAAAILVCAEPFAESLLEVGREFGINEFLLVKWLAPLASESPELLVAALFAWRLRAPIGLGALVSSKVNQWTLLVGTLPLVYGMSSFSLNGLPLGIQQRDELLVTAAQSAFAVAVLANRTMSRPEAWVMLALFVGQFASSGVLPERYAAPGRIAVGAIFLIGAAWVLRKDFGRLRTLVYDGLRRPVSELYADKSSL